MNFRSIVFALGVLALYALGVWFISAHSDSTCTCEIPSDTGAYVDRSEYDSMEMLYEKPPVRM